MARRILDMQHTGPFTVNGMDYIPFNQINKNFVSGGEKNRIEYNEQTRKIKIYNSSDSDYFITWELCLKTSTLQDNPVFTLEFQYDTFWRADPMIAPRKTGLIASSCLYSYISVVEDNSLTFGLRVIVPEKEKFYFEADTVSGISAKLNVIGF